MTHYVVVRADLPPGFLAAQIVHAAGESSPGNIGPGTNAVVLAATREELGALEQRLVESGIAHVAVREPDEPWGGALTAIGLVPVMSRASLHDHLSGFKLYRGVPRATGVPPANAPVAQ